jgi:hypothetical protein
MNHGKISPFQEENAPSSSRQLSCDRHIHSRRDDQAQSFLPFLSRRLLILLVSLVLLIVGLGVGLGLGLDQQQQQQEQENMLVLIQQHAQRPSSLAQSLLKRAPEDQSYVKTIQDQAQLALQVKAAFQEVRLKRYHHAPVPH